jgi:hypothetical protein
MASFYFNRLIYGQLVNKENKMSGYQPICATTLDGKTTAESLKWYEKIRPDITIGNPNPSTPIMAYSWTIKGEHYIWSIYYFSQSAEWASRERRNFISEYHVFIPLGIYDYLPISLSLLSNIGGKVQELLNKRYEEFSEIPPIEISEETASMYSSTEREKTLLKYLHQLQEPSLLEKLGLWILDNYRPKTNIHLKSTTLSLEKRLKAIDFAWQLLPQSDAKQFTFCSHSFTNSAANLCTFRFWEEKVPSPSQNSAYISDVANAYKIQRDGYVDTLIKFSMQIQENTIDGQQVVNLFQNSNINEINFVVWANKYKNLDSKSFKREDMESIFEKITLIPLSESIYELVRKLMQKIVVFAKNNSGLVENMQLYLRKNNLIQKLLENGFATEIFEIIEVISVRERVEILNETFAYSYGQYREHYINSYQRAVKDYFDLNQKIGDVDFLLDSLETIGFFKEYQITKDQLLRVFFEKYTNDKMLSAFLEKWANYGLPNPPYRAQFQSDLYSAYDSLLANTPLRDVAIAKDIVSQNLNSMMLIALNNQKIQFLSPELILQVCETGVWSRVTLNEIVKGISVELAAFLEISSSKSSAEQEKKYFDYCKKKNVSQFVYFVLLCVAKNAQDLLECLQGIFRKYQTEIKLPIWLEGIERVEFSANIKSNCQATLVKERITYLTRNTFGRELETEYQELVKDTGGIVVPDEVMNKLIKLGIDASKQKNNMVWLLKVHPPSWYDKIISQILSDNSVNVKCLEELEYHLEYIDKNDLAKTVKEKRVNIIDTPYNLASSIKKLAQDPSAEGNEINDMAFKLIQNSGVIHKFDDYQELVHYLLGLGLKPFVAYLLVRLDQDSSTRDISQKVRNALGNETRYIARSQKRRMNFKEFFKAKSLSKKNVQIDNRSIKTPNTRKNSKW